MTNVSFKSRHSGYGGRLLTLSSLSLSLSRHMRGLAHKSTPVCRHTENKIENDIHQDFTWFSLSD